LRAKDCHTGNVLAEEQAQAAKKEDVLNVLSQMASRFRSRVGESLATVERHNTPLAEATTSSLDALKAYSEGMKVEFSTSSAAAVPLFRRATEIDPNFALAYAHLGLVYSSIGESVLAVESTTKAYQLRDRASDRERFFITSAYHRQVTGNLERDGETCETWAQTYPRDINAHGLLSAFATQGRGQYEKSIEQAKITLSMDPDFSPGYENLAFGYFYADRMEEAARVIQKAPVQKRDLPELLLLRYYLGFVNGDSGEMEQAAAQARGRPGAEDWITHSQALVLARSGRVRAARAASRRAFEIAQQAGEKERAATFEVAEAVWQAFSGNAATAKRSTTAALALSNGRDVEYSAAVALAVAGELPRSRSLAADLEKRFPEDTSVQFNYLPVLRALFALNQHEPQKAVEALEPNVPYELAVPAIDFNAFFGGLYPVYVRGTAYLALNQGAQAAAEFQRVIDHRGLVAADPIGALARLQLARTYVLSHDRAKAKMAYEDFLGLWKDADPDIPILKEAKAEYAKLR
jgi:tetratricopeptide (TPR) repeat protein